MSVEFPRWLYRDDNLQDGVIVADEEQMRDARAAGFREWGEEPAEPVKRGPGRPRKAAA